MKGMTVQTTCIMLLLTLLSPLRASDWELVKDTDGIRVYARPAEGSPLDQFKGEAIIEAGFDTVKGIVGNIDSFPRWMDGCKSVKVLEQDAGDGTLLLYFVHHSPWPVRDRDSIVLAKTITDQARRVFTIEISSRDDTAIPPAPGMVRMVALTASFVISCVDETHTMIRFEISANPGGSLPAGLVNSFSKRHPYRTIAGLRKMATQGGGEHARD